ncbi:MAG: alpha/beta hydrolase [Ruminococcus flavefaciens]
MYKKPNRFLVMLRLFLIIILSIWLVIFIAHKILTHFELKYLEKEGIYNPVSVGEYDLNVYLCGNENGKHTLVGMSGQGVNTYSMGLKATVDRFASENRIAIVDRAGYGLSDSTTVPQTVEQVVEDYRTALKKAGCKAPYILIPHSIGGLYATYWQSVYPDEIEGMFILDGSLVSEEDYFYYDSAHELFLTALCNTGLQRVLHDAMKGEISWRNLTLKQQKAADIMEMHSTYTFSQHSESVLMEENYAKTVSVMTATSSPKMYIYAMPSTPEEVREYLEYKNESYRSAGKEPPYDMSDTEMIQQKTDEFIDADVDRTLYTSSYCNNLGNCKIRKVGGIHNIYKQKPDELAALLAELIEATEQ